ncbi:cupredoxin domain-containing protein [Rhodoligotrophos ferricapiens]|uniref:cupredoxin domain-containing protein n=1 Tax=Rhodoligotrophos ferricapiens TaxID=3069264 RepID=UPI003D8132CA
MRTNTAFIIGALMSGLAVPALADAGHSHEEARVYGEPGDPSKPAKTLTVRMKEADDGRMTFEPSKISIKRGEQVRFVLKNIGELEHEFVVATVEDNLKHAIEMQKNPDMEHDDPNAKRLKPGENGEIVWKFTQAGTFDFSCLIPGHRESGMYGTIVVK